MIKQLTPEELAAAPECVQKIVEAIVVPHIGIYDGISTEEYRGLHQQCLDTCPEYLESPEYIRNWLSVPEEVYDRQRQEIVEGLKVAKAKYPYPKDKNEFKNVDELETRLKEINATMQREIMDPIHARHREEREVYYTKGYGV